MNRHVSRLSEKSLFISRTAVRGLCEDIGFPMAHLTKFELFRDRPQMEGLHHSKPPINLCRAGRAGRSTSCHCLRGSRRLKGLKHVW